VATRIQPQQLSPATSFPRENAKKQAWCYPTEPILCRVSNGPDELGYTRQTSWWHKRKETSIQEMQHAKRNTRVRPYILKVGAASPLSLSLRRSNRARPFSLCTNNPTSKMDLASQIWGRTSQALPPGPFKPWEAQSHLPGRECFNHHL
jgi:hypothetical protein